MVQELSAKRISKADVSRALESVFGSITPGGQLKPGTDRLDDEDEGEEDSPDQGEIQTYTALRVVDQLVGSQQYILGRTLHFFQLPVFHPERSPSRW